MSLLKIAHLSDPHFGTVYPEVQDGLLKTLRRLQPDLVIFSGDISQRARASQFRAGYEFKKALMPISCISIPGNHDIPLFNFPVRLFKPYWGYESIFRGEIEADFSFSGVQVLCLNSTSRFRHIQGAFQMDRLKKRLQQFRSDSVYRIVTFHQPLDCPKRVDLKNLLRDPETVVQLLAEAKVDLVLNGHIHDPLVSTALERYPTAKWASVFSVAGTCLSWRTRADAGNSFHWIELQASDSKSMKITRFDYDGQSNFHEVDAKSFQKDSQIGWRPL